MKNGPNETDVLVGTRVRIRRVELGLSQTQLANALGVTFQQVQKYEKGVNRIGASRLHAIAGVLHVPVSYFFPAAGEEVNHGASTSEVLALLGFPGAMDLLRNFARIPDRSVREAISLLARTLAKEGQAAGQPTTAH